MPKAPKALPTATKKRSTSPSSPPLSPSSRSSSASSRSSPFLASHSTRMSYRIGRGEEGVLTFEPYKGHLLPLWRFKTQDVARTSSKALVEEFERFLEQGDFVGCDMTRKFLQMGMTRATRYARRPGGRKYDKASGDLLPIDTSHPGSAEKAESAAIFRKEWEKAKENERYRELRKEWEREKKEWEKSGKGERGEPKKKRRKKEEKEGSVKEEKESVKREEEEVKEEEQ
ncbi:hypothetical protein JCM8547_007498 [Rhodosporidiobolus lusitaniae]